MSKWVTISVIVGVFALVLLTYSPVNAAGIYSVTDWLIPNFEGFSATPYWDVSRYSWGYGTPAPGATGTITKDKALAELRAHVQNDYATLRPQITRELTPDQWGAYLSFAYNLGTGNPGAGALVDDINAGNDAALETHWKKYVYSDGVVNDTLVDRRNQEWDVWQS